MFGIWTLKIVGASGSGEVEYKGDLARAVSRDYYKVLASSESFAFG